MASISWSWEQLAGLRVKLVTPNMTEQKEGNPWLLDNSFEPLN